MESIVFTLCVLLTSAAALPSELETNDLKTGRNLDETVRLMLEGVIHQAKSFDPYSAESALGEFIFPVPGVFSAVGSVENFLLSGFSDIEIVDIGFVVTTLNVEVRLIGFVASIDNAVADVSIFNRNLKGQLSGSVAVNDIRINLEADLANLAEHLIFSFSIGDIQSELNIEVNDRDLSDVVNNWFRITLPITLEKYEVQLSRIIARQLKPIIERIF
ncbi:PREDICTED: uncharacterized protein LOC106111102 [Papilio polytes]|uniref:uncharacterized protein LOC106111102 n=1 Tax=Papilio polytes TaxID=76194 RepID=UPI000675C37B|nr:PREDICTED: uncharacterized protein LOC106111102 [Papilio polytes]